MRPTDIEALRARIVTAIGKMATWRPDASYEEWAKQRDALLDMMDDYDRAEGRPVFRRERAKSIRLSVANGDPGSDQ